MHRIQVHKLTTKPKDVIIKPNTKPDCKKAHGKVRTDEPAIVFQTVNIVTSDEFFSGSELSDSDFVLASIGAAGKNGPSILVRRRWLGTCRKLLAGVCAFLKLRRVA